MSEWMNQRQGVKDRGPWRLKVVEGGGNFGCLWDRTDPSAWVTLPLLLCRQPETPPCHFFSNPLTPWRIPNKASWRCTGTKIEQFRSWLLGFFAIDILSWPYIKKQLMHECRNRNPVLILFLWAERSALLHWWHRAISHQCPPFFLPFWAMIHHCLGLCHWCQLAHLPPPLPSPAPFRDAWREAIMLVSHEQMVRLRCTHVLVEGLKMSVWKEQLWL